MHKVAIYRRYAYQSTNHRPRWSFVLTIHHVNKHEIVFHNLKSLFAYNDVQVGMECSYRNAANISLCI